MKLKKLLSLIMVLVIAVAVCNAGVFAAGADVDFTLRPVTDNVDEFAPGDTVVLEVVITTKTSNGYDSFTLEINYNEDVLVYSDEAFDEDGCSGSASNGVLTLSYTNPNGENSKLNSVNIIRVKFTVLEGAPGGETSFGGKVKTCTGKNTTGASTARQTAPMYDKKITIADISYTTSQVTDTDYSEIITGLTGNEEDDVSSTVTVVKKGGMPVFWAIVLILLAFAGGLVVGYKICENKMGGTVSRRRYDDDIEDEDDEELPTFSKKKAPLRRPSLADEDDGSFDTSYFGRASEVSIGSEFFDKYDTDAGSTGGNAEASSDFDDDDSGFPGSFFPRGYSGRRETPDDDGFGSFDPVSAEASAKMDSAFDLNFNDGGFNGDDDFGDDIDDMDNILRRR